MILLYLTAINVNLLVVGSFKNIRRVLPLLNAKGKALLREPIEIARLFFPVEIDGQLGPPEWL